MCRSFYLAQFFGFSSGVATLSSFCVILLIRAPFASFFPSRGLHSGSHITAPKDDYLVSCIIGCALFCFVVDGMPPHDVYLQMRDKVNTMENVVGFIGKVKDEKKKFIPDRMSPQSIVEVKAAEAELNAKTQVRYKEKGYVRNMIFRARKR